MFGEYGCEKGSIEQNYKPIYTMGHIGYKILMMNFVRNGFLYFCCNLAHQNKNFK